MINIDRFRMKTLLIGLFVTSGLIPLFIIGGISAFQAQRSLMNQSYNQLEAIRSIKTAKIEKFFNEREGDIGVLVETVSTLRTEAFRKLNAVQSIKKAHLADYINQLKTGLLLLEKNPMVVQGLVDFERVFKTVNGKIDDTRWQAVAGKYDKRLRELNEINGWYDLFLINPAGSIIYTVERESDLGMSIPDTALKDSGIGEAFSKAKEITGEGLAMGDFKPYAPSNGDPAAFFMSPVRNDRGVLLGYVALQFPLDQVNKIMLNRDGMGNTGESYLVGSDMLMRSDSFLNPENFSVTASFKNGNKVDTHATRKGLEGETGTGVIQDYNNNPVLSTWTPVELDKDITWVMISELDVAEAFSPVDEQGNAFFAKYKEMYGYYDLFLINPDGYVFYTVTKEADYQTNMVNGPYADSNLGKLVRKTLDSKAFGFADFEPYAPSHGDPAAFIAQPVVHDGKPDLVVALQISLDAINDIMSLREGMGETGESYLVGADNRMRSDSYLDKTNRSVVASFAGNIKNNGVDTEASRQALAGSTGTGLIIDYNGNSVLSSYAPLKMWDTTWALISEIDESEVKSPVYALLVFIAISCILIAIFGFIVATYITRRVIYRLGGEPAEIAEIANTVSLGDLSLELSSEEEATGVYQDMVRMVANLKETASLAEKIAGGDLTVKVNLLSDKDMLGKSLDGMVRQLSGIVHEISTASSNVAAGSGELSSASQSLSVGATQQASSLEEISSSMTEIEQQVKQNAENGVQATQLTEEARNHASSGDTQMNRMVSAMEEINESSREIAKIIKVIDEIAFQTNLLALNAAVEAARAGKDGKGFAVVAEEVRNLASRSAEAAKETEQMIERSINKVSEGNSIVEQTASAFQEIVVSVGKINDLVKEIANASNEQALGVSQVSQGLEQIDQVTQQNSAHAEETASSSEELSSQAMLLQEQIDFFNIGGSYRSMKPSRTAGVYEKIPAAEELLKIDTTNSKQVIGSKEIETQVEPHLAGRQKIILDDTDFDRY